MAYEKAVYYIKVDWDDDGDFTNDGYTTDSDRIQHIHIDRGYSGPLARYPTVGRATVRLDNSGRWYSPTQNANALPRRQVQITMSYDGGEMTIFRGFLESIAPYPGQYRDRYVVLECVDAIALLDQHEGEIPIQENVYADDVIDLVVSDATYGAYTPPSTSYDAGLNHFPTSCERWNWEGGITVGGPGGAGLRTERTSASSKIIQACTSDWGRFFIDKSGIPKYYNRHRMPLDDSTDLTLSNVMTDMQYSYSIAPIFNRIEVTCHPRHVGATYEVIGRISQGRAPMIEASGASTYTIRYRDPANPSIRIGGKDIQTPVANTDYVCTKDTGGGAGTDVGSITPTVTAYSDHADVTMTNGNAFPVFVQQLNLRGYAVRVREPITMVSEDATSQSDYQVRTLAINASLMDNPIHAQNLADYLLDVYKDPQHVVTGLTFCANHANGYMLAARNLDLMAKVEVTEQQTGLSSFEGHITRMVHDISMNRYLHMVTYDLETPYTISGTPFTIGTSTLDSAHVFIY